ncbi:isocitrate lyase/PEP mutase family protein [Pararhizobium haloflavum]|uniref:isocitrate lyase/PEP mutase family protein n=1 Tax=Pararhizobium haloflavum TaxID=2037914 RepID=UPI000C179911|nr:isocitrate lyase/phosphoenolpyruvate mutase family protein [Pararhizobium haloflavum]
MSAFNPSPGDRFLSLHRKGDPVIMPNPWDVGTARLFAGLGFEAIATSSAAHAFTLGRRDGTVSWSERLDHARTMVSATSLPVNADLENGKGHDPDTVAVGIAEAAETGMAGCSIEDHSGDPRAPIYDSGLAVERIAAACEARDRLGRTFVLTARAENFLWGRQDLDDTIARLRAFELAGADVLYAPGLPSLAAIRTVCSALSKPVNVLAGIPADPPFTRDQLAEAGVARISLGSQLSKLVYGTLIDAARAMRQDGSFAFVEKAAPSSLIEGYISNPAPADE